jgi:hypothetical protein
VYERWLLQFYGMLPIPPFLMYDTNYVACQKS